MHPTLTLTILVIAYGVVIFSVTFFWCCGFSLKKILFSPELDRVIKRPRLFSEESDDDATSVISTVFVSSDSDDSDSDTKSGKHYMFTQPSI